MNFGVAPAIVMYAWADQGRGLASYKHTDPGSFEIRFRALNQNPEHEMLEHPRNPDPET